MALYLVLEDYSDGAATIAAGSLLDDAAVDLPRLQSAGLAVVAYVPSTMSASREAFLAARGSRPVAPDSSGDLTALLLAAGAIGGAGGPAITQLTGDVTAVGPGVATAALAAIGGNPVSLTPLAAGEALTWNGTSWTNLLATALAGSSFTFGPSLPQNPGNNVYSSWADLCAALAALPAGIFPTITIYESATVPLVGMPAGGWDLRSATIQAPTLATGSVELTVPDGVIIDNLASITTALIVHFSPSADGALRFSFAASLGSPWALFLNHGALIQNYGTGALVDLTTAPAGTYFVFATVAPPFTAFPVSTGPFVRNAAGQTVISAQIQGSVFTALPTDWCVGAGGSLIYQLGVDAVIPATPGYAGSITYLQESLVTIRDSFGAGGTLGLSLPGGLATIAAADAGGVPAPLDLRMSELQANGSPGNAGEVLTSNGAGVAPTWQPLVVPQLPLMLPLEYAHSNVTPALFSGVYLSAGVTLGAGSTALLHLPAAGRQARLSLTDLTGTPLATWTSPVATGDQYEVVPVAGTPALPAGWYLIGLESLGGGAVGAHGLYLTV